MKKTASLLLAILLFATLFYNAVEYYMLVSYQKEQSWVSSMQNTPDSEFKVIKLNATLYTFIEDSEIQNVNENIVIDSKVYHVFKKSIKDNVLNLYYLGDENLNAIDVSLKQIVDGQSDNNSDKSPVSKIIKSFSKDYVANDYRNVVFNLKTSVKTQSVFENQNQKLLSGFTFSNYPPPKLV
jgi:hypothetical protein